MSKLIKVRTLFALGLGNLARVGLYRLGLKMGWHPSMKLAGKVVSGPFFHRPAQTCRPGLIARSHWQGNAARMFGLVKGRLEGTTVPPDWFTPIEGGSRAVSAKPWWQIPDFDPDVGDIKRVWEASRFDWLLALAQRAALGDDEELARLNAWLQDWSSANHPYLGVNWKCGQEASIRVIHLALAAMILGDDNTPGEGLKDLVRLHLRRIAPTMGYAIGQANNHGTSEAAALFVGGSWLGDPDGQNWASTGQKWLENRARALIGKDGTFSQYSVTYHRLMLDTYCMAEAWRRRRNLPEFSDRLMRCLSAATSWLENMTDPTTGDTPVLGANDGAQIITLTECDHRDFRPSVQLASALFRRTRAYQSGPWDQQLGWMGVDLPERFSSPPMSVSLDDGGFHVLRKGSTVAYLRYPRFKFRPSQADALHCDLWINGENVLRDAGTYSYNVSDEDTAYFNGTVSHNTIEFDGRDQMPRLGRFLFGDWLKSDEVALVDERGERAGASYRDKWGARHGRFVELGTNKVSVQDDISGFKERAVLRWRVNPGDWNLDNQTLFCGDLRLTIRTSVPIRRIELTDGHESRYYLQKIPVPVLEVEVDQPGTVTTEICF